ncbi:unnamed protein product [Caenorhabditis angaria]|uniref:SXP/RAL-2 family protein Ani s 5-like cation-binding domain-containing protein n=1 Tax=Caenorhabditis angaria TaxID=860376 RepID=A0A9P1N5I3_9PELO|nr:unnamed protein product [Caenorhabditis angaria]
MLFIYLAVSLFVAVSASMNQFSENEYADRENVYGEQPSRPNLDKIRSAVEQDVGRISDEVSYVSKQINFVLSNPKISPEDRQEALELINIKHPRVAPTILNLVSALRMFSPNKQRFP